MTATQTIKWCRAAIWLRIALVALPLAFSASAPAHAGASVDACFNAIGDAAKASISAAEKGADFVKNNCEQWANPATADLFAAVAGIVTVLDAAGAFKGGSCKDFVKTKIAAALVAALAGAIGGNNPLAWFLDSLPDSASVKAEIQQLANNISAAGSDQAAQAAAEQAYDILSNIPVLGQAISMLPCACIVADAAVKSADDLAQTASQGAQCGEFALACAESPLSCAESLFESGWDAIKDFGDWVVGELKALGKDIEEAYCATLGHLLGGCSSKPPAPTPVNCVGGAMLSGDVRDLGNGTLFSVTSNQFCSCPATMKWQDNGGVWSCGCPIKGQVQVAPGICECAGNTGLLNGSCKTCPTGTQAKGGFCLCPIAGQLASELGCACPKNETPVGNVCLAICTDPKKVLMKNGMCCGAGQLTSCGECCPDGQVPDPKSGSCVAAGGKP